jgi:hypothetical protein
MTSVMTYSEPSLIEPLSVIFRKISLLRHIILIVRLLKRQDSVIAETVVEEATSSVGERNKPADPSLRLMMVIHHTDKLSK